MRIKPNLSDFQIFVCLYRHYGLRSLSLVFLPIGYDPNTVVYRVVMANGMHYFLKLRSGEVYPPSLLIPRLLIENGIPNILAPLRTLTNELSCSLVHYSVVLYPFIQGENAMHKRMTDQQWREFGTTLNAIHSSGLRPEQLPVEDFSLASGKLVRTIQALVSNTHFESKAAQKCAYFWKDNAEKISRIVARAEELGKQLQTMPFEFVLCHSDIHAANIMITEEGHLFLVDWDSPLLAPRERDLLFIVGSIIAHRVSPQEEEWFFEGYGTTEINRTALAYYRYERAIEDLGEGGRSVFLTTGQSEAAIAEEAQFTMGLFAPGNIFESALEADRELGI